MASVHHGPFVDWHAADSDGGGHLIPCASFVWRDSRFQWLQRRRKTPLDVVGRMDSVNTWSLNAFAGFC